MIDLYNMDLIAAKMAIEDAGLKNLTEEEKLK